MNLSEFEPVCVCMTLGNIPARKFSIFISLNAV